MATENHGKKKIKTEKKDRKAKVENIKKNQGKAELDWKDKEEVSHFKKFICKRYPLTSSKKLDKIVNQKNISPSGKSIIDFDLKDFISYLKNQESSNGNQSARRKPKSIFEERDEVRDLFDLEAKVSSHQEEKEVRIISLVLLSPFFVE